MQRKNGSPSLTQILLQATNPPPRPSLSVRNITIVANNQFCIYS